MARTILATLVLLATAALLFLVGGSSRAGCLWDSDTLRAEAAGAPGLVETIVGRFDRFPPLYYEMRLDRAAADVAASPAALAAYDDAAVACDRLGRHDEAIVWMARKRVALDVMPDSEERTEHEYRYLANLGTFHAHRWIARGAHRGDPQAMADLETARDLIAQAIALNPQAHFGRERYQRMAIEWILEPTPANEGRYWVGNYTSILDRIPHEEGWHGASHWNELAKAGYADAADGFAGLVALGNGWNSFDVFHALALALQDRGHASLAYLAWLRAEEVVRTGPPTQPATLHPDMKVAGFNANAHASSLTDGDQQVVRAFYTKARAEADAWHQARTAYITARLQAGEHPDTHPDFYAQWAEPSSMPALPNGFLGRGGHDATILKAALAVGGVVLAMVLALTAIPLLYLRRRASQPATIPPA